MEKNFKADQLFVRVFDTRAEMGDAAAKDISAGIKETLKDRDTVNMIFAAAPSQSEVLERLASDKTIPWERVRAFHMDEYIGLPSDAPQGFGNFLRERLFSKVPLLSAEYINGCAADVDAECARYAALLKEYPADIVVMGIGENGHIAFNDPGVADFRDPAVIKPVLLDEICRNQQVHDGCFPDINAVPTRAVTITLPALISAPRIFCIVRQAVSIGIRVSLHERIHAQRIGLRLVLARRRSMAATRQKRNRQPQKHTKHLFAFHPFHRKTFFLALQKYAFLPNRARKTRPHLRPALRVWPGSGCEA